MSFIGVSFALLNFVLLLAGCILLDIWADGNRFLIVFYGVIWLAMIFMGSKHFAAKGWD